ncbi:MAG: GreA/GreB family elongation factor, partial [Devosia sp.]
ATVKILDEDTEKQSTYIIVGEAEADLSNGRIAITSPVARAMIGKSKGDSFEVPAPGGTRSYEIIDLKYV